MMEHARDGVCLKCCVTLMLAERMLEELQIAARYGTECDARILLAKRDALSELVRRVKYQQRNERWMLIRPVVGQSSPPVI